jgi:predicted DCC family thiol-disulfide oxidoreductase YuxK
MAQVPALTLYYDGTCPLCRAEIDYLRHKDREGQLDFVDITTAKDDLESLGLSCERAMQLMQGRLQNGEVIEGVPVFAAAYRLVGFQALAWILSRACLQGLLGHLYATFAKHRHRISRWLGPFALKISGFLTRHP